MQTKSGFCDGDCMAGMSGDYVRTALLVPRSDLHQAGSRFMQFLEYPVSGLRLFVFRDERPPCGTNGLPPRTSQSLRRWIRRTPFSGRSRNRNFPIGAPVAESAIG